ncbi:hypothetical protein CONPUDRAFT_52330 [Coniophora puteana RWD-64-598 SS2]|uniref:pH-response regulator protein palC n=1 Tax=Coniophora puteana (strain RWD-64-598) TaxID=741705 RepID=A0A5M3MUY5_CONPW|nr:uncharacterized protein CONPUDRAFT_52330 [Coniophora puteana RWD-64-598 SS2]EIW82850.1 hypothetical protein CONPUDRAFT_52330 [Coniophora puteana RWD-64-598 SS2]
MSVYLYELPTTGAISFSDFCIDESDGRIHTSHLAEATQARANLRSALKESKRTDRDEKDYLKLIKIIDEYLPQLYGIVTCVNADEIRLKAEPVFSWRTTLSANLFNTSPRLSMTSLHADLASSILTYAFALSNLARSTVVSLGMYEYERSIADIERRAKDEKLSFAVTLLCRASGAFEHLSERILMDWDRAMETGLDAGNVRPADLRREVCSALAKVTCADAQSLAIRKLQSKSAYDSTLTPGPPLPRSHPSPSLIAKLHLECASYYSSALSLVLTPGKTKSSKGGNDEINAELRHYLSGEAAFHSALSHKWLGVDAGENGGPSKGGEAVAFLLWAKKELEELKEGAKGLGSIGRDKEKKDRRKEKVSDELASVTVFLKNYKKVNDTLTFQPVPPQMELQSRIPAGRLAVAPKPFAPPPPAFKPSSIERLAEQLDLNGSGSSSLETPSDMTNPRSYAGEGSYF